MTVRIELFRGAGRRRGSVNRPVATSAVSVLLLVGFIVALPAASAAAEPPILWGKEPLVCPTGSGAGQCVIPRGVIADPENGHVFAADQTNHRIVEFDALGQFIKAWGWDVVESGPGDDAVSPEDQFEICIPAQGDVCKAGTAGGGVGQIVRPQGVALDSLGNIYVTEGDFSNRRVQKFDPEGDPLLTFGGEVNKTKVEVGGSSEAEENLCPFDPGDECQAAIEGSGNGQFGSPWLAGDFIAIDGKSTSIDSDDKIYVGDTNRIQIFDTGGHYQSEFAVSGVVQSLSTDDAGNLYVIYNGQPDVRKLTSAGVELVSPRFQIPTAGGPVVPSAVAVDSLGNVYAFGPALQDDDPIFQFDSTGALIAQFGGDEFSDSTGLATNLCPGSEAPGSLYVTNASFTEAFLRAYGTDPLGCFRARTLPADPVNETSVTLNGTVNPKSEAVTECFFEYGATTSYGQIAPCQGPDATEIGTGSSPVSVHADIGSLVKGTDYHFRLIAKVGGETEIGADEDFKTLGPPVISAEHTESATDTEASLEALVNPEGFATSCTFNYGLDKTYGQSTPSQSIGSDRSGHAVSVELKALMSGVAYHWQVVCTNKSGTAEGGDSTFATFLPPEPEPGCSNNEFRTGASAALPDCRTYEMVSPVDKNGGDIVRESSGAGDPGGYMQASIDGNRLTYTSLSAFSDLPNAFNFNQYLTTRTKRGVPGEGWSSEGIHTPVAGQEADSEFDIFGFLREFIAFSPDLCSAWLVDHQTPPPTANGQEGYPNLYRRQNCGLGAGSFEALVPNPPYELPPGTLKNYVERDSVQGYSDDGRHVIFVAKAALIDEAAENSNPQIYAHFGSAVHLVSVLPDGSPGDPIPGDGKGVPNSSSSEVGSGPGRGLERAVSTDGSRVYWSSNKIFLREHPAQGIVEGECDGSAACTWQVSSGTARFWAAAADGSRAIYSEGGNLFEFDQKGAKEEPPAPPRAIASDVKSVVGTSENLSRIYFISTQALPEAGANSEEEEASDGKANLYLEEDGAREEGGAISFVGTLGPGDVGQLEPGATATAYDLGQDPNPIQRATRVTPDGSRIVFNSRAPLTGYDNTAAGDGRPAVEVFIYEAGGGLLCVSCNPSRARPSVRELRQPYIPPWGAGKPTKVPAAAWIPTWEHPLHASNALSADGSRLFFNSFDALLPRDTNGAQDVYEWEAPGTGSCDEADANYFAQNGGCLYLISTGDSPYESEFWEASTDGRDVFFTTESSLLPQDPGSVDLYDARVGGGFPQPIKKAGCEGEACQSPPAPPQLPTGASATYSGPENPPKAKKCPKGKHKVKKAGKAKCVKKKKHKKGSGQRRANRGRGAAR